MKLLSLWNFSHPRNFVILPGNNSNLNQHQIPERLSSLQGTKNTGENLMKLDISQSFIHKFWANPPLSVMNYQYFTFKHCKHFPYTIWRWMYKQSLQRSVNIHTSVQVVICTMKYLWPPHLPVQFAVHLARVVPEPVLVNKDRLFCIPSSHPLLYTQHFPSAVPSSPN